MSLWQQLYQIHLLETKWKELDSAKQAKVITFIAEAKNLAFAEGIKPGSNQTQHQRQHQRTRCQ
jgi:hypothetical protein